MLRHLDIFAKDALTQVRKYRHLLAVVFTLEAIAAWGFHFSFIAPLCITIAILWIILVTWSADWYIQNRWRWFRPQQA